jgi:hypothetical protein
MYFGPSTSLGRFFAGVSVVLAILVIVGNLTG